ncbi:MAG: protein-L-isoaspartate O-methyltransferase [Pseudomonadota bacterium]
MGDEAAVLRMRMVNNQLRTFDVTDHRVQDAMLAVARERFVPSDQRVIAYSDEAIPLTRDAIGRPTRSMTRPAILARLLQLAQIGEDDVVLVVGAGLGYAAAVVGQLSGSVIALETDGDLADKAAETLEDDEATNVVVVTGPLENGYPSEAPYDVIFCDGAVLSAPHPLLAQLKDGGRLVTIEGEGLAGRAKIYTKDGDSISSRAVFNAAGAVLPGFTPKPEFMF